MNDALKIKKHGKKLARFKQMHNLTQNPETQKYSKYFEFFYSSFLEFKPKTRNSTRLKNWIMKINFFEFQTPIF